jgi:hypothetical protein
MAPRWAFIAIAAAASAALTSCSSGTAPSVLPPAGSGFDYQLGGAYPPADDVEVVVRDRTDPPVDGVYSVCYVNGFQTQPDERRWWLDRHPDLVLRDDAGDPVTDPDWPDEMLLDPTTPEKREALAAIVGAWIAECAADGYQAVEIDNLDTYARSVERISIEDAVAYIGLLAARAHDEGLAIGQKNAADLVSRRDETGLDFVITEECNRYDECAAYVDGFGDQVYVVEYRRADFEAGCADFPDLSIVLRDRDLRPAGEPGHVRAAC